MDEFDALRELEQLRQAHERLQQKHATAKAKTADLISAVEQAARDAIVAVGHPKPISGHPREDKRRRKAESALLVCSDWHVGKRTQSFDSDVAARRVEKLAVKVAKITAIERADHPVRDCHLILAGDFVDGMLIFPGQPYEVDSTLFAQLFKAAAMVEGLIRELLRIFDTVTCWCQTGNHGRIGRKGDMPRGDNVDRMLYRIVLERFHEDRLKWHLPSSWFSIVNIGSYKALLIHGDQIKSFGGNLPAYGIARKCNAWASGVLPEFTDVHMGHFHQPLVIPLANGRGRVFVSPSIESDSAYAREFVAATGSPSQRLLFVDPAKSSITSERLLYLD